MTIEKIRVSIGSAAVLGLETIEFKDPPTTCYIMTFKSGHCKANCGFCPQARESDSSTYKLSRIYWPIYPFKDFLTKLRYVTPLKRFKRICVQTLNYPENFADLMEIITHIKRSSDIPISVAIPPIAREELSELKLKGVQRVGIALDGATPEIFEKIKGKEVNGPYRWETHLQCLKDAVDIFSEGYVSTHIIVGLGETQKDIIKLIIKLKSLKILPGLFAFTPVKGTKFESVEQPDVINFRKVQLGRYLILNKDKELGDFAFNSKGEIINININKNDLRNLVEEDEAFLTSGCPGCNRPYYTSKPSGPIYNYPRKLKENEKEEIFNSLQRFVK